MKADDYIDTSQAAEVLGLSVAMVTYLIRTGQLDAIKVSRIWLVNRASVEDYARRRQAGEIRPGVKKKGQ